MNSFFILKKINNTHYITGRRSEKRLLLFHTMNYQEEDDLNATLIPYPYIAIPPPTQQPSNMELFLSLLHLLCLTSILCGNVSQLVLQLYTRRLRDTTHVQQFLAFFFLINAFVSLGTPWMIVETLVRHWTFGQNACRVYQATAQLGRTLLPYIIVALYVITGMSINPSRKCRIRQSFMSMMFVIIFALLVLFIIIPVIGSSTLDQQIHGNHLPGELYSVMFESFFCVIPFAEEVYTDGVALFVEVLVPIALCTVCALKLKMITKEISTVISINSVNYYLFWISIIHFSTSFWYYFSVETKQWIFDFLPSPMDYRDIICLLPYISSSLTWYPASDLSAFWSLHENHSESPESFPSRNSSRHVRLVVPSSASAYSNCHMPLSSQNTCDV
ncbi:G-protein coupled receptors family 1 profile domain-containing protein [Caenorhabditis elegans]|uniref:G-protein coupled receptors family 1 profile domain-containing protein n=2 Tax=Caenorhabditis elegans TaxID=6239 RepID=M1ZJY8_CAEEL|nr:G-protein coupled receptors family 1 profile domain-containing protein [Caenorhabditis elegans]CCU83324.1 G-protein coupled receptors family 1 profile domain-containing protein [Caenorhabditis elegans]|eukprot:NP_001294230.1 BTB and MATH domain containing [Caenorhabditis elegans]